MLESLHLCILSCPTVSVLYSIVYFVKINEIAFFTFLPIFHIMRKQEVTDSIAVESLEMLNAKVHV